MIKYMVIAYGRNIQDEWVEIKHSDLSDIRQAEDFRAALVANSQIDPANVHVIQYKE